MMNLLKKHIFYLSLALAMIAGLSSCKNKTDNVIKIGVLEGPSAISFISMYDNPQQIDNKNIEFVIKSDPQQIQALMMRDELDFAILPTVMAANLYNKGLHYKALAFPVWGTLYLLSSDSTINDIQDLSNKNVSVFGQGATPDVLLRRFIDYEHLQNISIHYATGGNSDLAQQMLHHTIKTAVISEPLVSMLTSKDSTIRIIHKLDCKEYIFNSETDIFTQTVFLVSRKFADKNPDEVGEISDMYSNSCNFINENPAAASALLVKHGFAENQLDAEKSLPFCNIKYIGAFAVENELQLYLNIFFNFDPESIGGKLPDRNFIYQPE